ncbi:MAG TPA: PASTA domain-containing protein [Candidatus Limnocylindria bacterium]|nr:PASTA domain-containing protein [Candidatus Limnocylindria bacterium]
MLVARRETSGEEVDAQPIRAPAVLRPSLEPAQAGLMPDVRGLSAREALRTLSRAGVAASLDGSGFVVDQSIPPGAALARGESCILRLGRRAVATIGESTR